ncbi:MAG: Rrf2 family transcriptional regulator [Planctomycetaceae bacterium]|nr:Rrf2 family transcriptional regulator [Planctomycetaceae bacterium]
MLSQTVEYALRAVIQLAYNQPHLCSTSFLAEKTKVPPAYLSKVLQSLVRSGIVHSQRGVGGGMTLQIPAEQMTLLDIVNAVDPIKRIRTCPLGIKTHGVNLCPLHSRLDQTLALMEDAFRKATLADILAEKSDSVPLCETTESPLKPLLELRHAPENA